MKFNIHITSDLREMGCKDVNSIELALDHVIAGLWN
jgi:hypothetical protein